MYEVPDNPMARPEQEYEGQREPDFTMTIPKMWDAHWICDACWRNREPYRDPVRFVEAARQWVDCCFCLNPTFSGIVVRESVLNVKCPVRGHDRG